MGYAARANHARRLRALHEGAAHLEPGIVEKIAPTDRASREVVGLRMARLLALMPITVVPGS
jgi:hypothetical protein